MDKFEGRISSSSFSSGDRIVVGDWISSPLGSFINIMWARPDGKRILISPSKNCADYVSTIYSFEEVIILPIDINRKDKKIEINALDLSIIFEWGISAHIPFKRPKWFISTIEYLVGNIIFGTKTHGKTKDGRKEWYMIREISMISKAYGRFKGESFGRMENNTEASRFGFSEPPKRPMSVLVNSLIEKN